MSELKVGKSYYKKIGIAILVRKIEKIDGCKVTSRFVYGYKKNLLGKLSTCHKYVFSKWLEFNAENFTDLEGCSIYKNSNVQGPDGNLYFNCTSKKASFYLRKGYAFQVREGVIQLFDWKIIHILQKLHGKNFSANNSFFLAEKNKCCVVCGKENRLTRHHIVPVRIKKKLPEEIKKCFSNIVFVCIDCHVEYEQHILKNKDFPSDFSDSMRYCLQCWEHFAKIAKPKYLPSGFKFFTKVNSYGCNNVPSSG